jgi:amidase
MFESIPLLGAFDQRVDMQLEESCPANETGLPAISIPAGLDSDGLPIGAQFYGNFTGEDLLLRLAVQLEQARPEWFGARPEVHVTA